MMTFDELQREVYEDLNGRITAVRLKHDALEIDFECDHWRRDGRVAVTLVCAGARTWTVTPGPTGWFELLGEHPLLWEHNEPHASIYFSSAPENAWELSGRLREAIDRLFDGEAPRERYLHATAGILAVGYGQLASGPRPVVDAVHRVAETFVDCTVIGSRRPVGDFRLLHTDKGSVVCRSVSLRERASTVPASADDAG